MWLRSYSRPFTRQIHYHGEPCEIRLARGQCVFDNAPALAAEAQDRARDMAVAMSLTESSDDARALIVLPPPRTRPWSRASRLPLFFAVAVFSALPLWTLSQVFK